MDEERYAAEFLEADASLSDAGYEHYEVSNYARPGRRARHNSAYWRRAPFIGLGPSAHSAWGSTRRWNLREWSAYERAVGAGEIPIAGTEQLDPAAVALEELYLGLRTRDGVPLDRLPPETVRSGLRPAGPRCRRAAWPHARRVAPPRRPHFGRRLSAVPAPRAARTQWSAARRRALARPRELRRPG